MKNGRRNEEKFNPLVSKKNSVIKRERKKVNFSGEIFGEENFASSLSKLLPRVFSSFSTRLELS